MALGESGRPLSLQRAGVGKIDRRFFTAAHCGIYFALGLTLACARAMENCAPFGMALVAAAGPGLSGVSALLGATLGYLGAGGLEWGIRYAAASVLVYTAAFVFHELSVYRARLFMPAVAGGVMAAASWLGSAALTQDLYGMLSALFLETCLAFGSAFFFREALAGSSETEGGELLHGVALMILLACLLMTV